MTTGTVCKYDPSKNARGCFEAAVAEIRIRGVRSGKYKPVNDAERKLAAEGER
jgi:hypothetical protein